MYRESYQLSDLLRDARRRRRALLLLRGASVCLVAGAIVLLLTGWAAARYRYSEATLLVLRLGAVLTFAVTAYLALVRPLMKRVSDVRLARLIEERTAGADNRLVTAVEVSASDAPGRSQASEAILGRLLRDADRVAADVDLDSVIRRRRLIAYGLASLACLIFFAGVLRWGPGAISEGVTQLVTPASLAANNNSLSITVKPGTARVPKGSDQRVVATLVNFETEAATLFSRPVGAGDTEWQGQPMEPAKAKSDFQFSIFNIQDSVEYFVEASGTRSDVFKLDVVDLPFVKQLDLSLNYPAYTRIAAKTIEDGGQIVALKGTVATVTARLTGRVRAARIVFGDSRKVEMRAVGSDFVGAITVTGDTTYYIELVSLDGETYRGSNEYDITLLEDLPPTITFERPGRDAKATNLEEVFTQARAEDDYGVASIEMFFSVNGGQEQKVNLRDLSRDAARSLTGTHTFFLEEFKLKPGDFISYYAKARDAQSEATSDIYFIEIKPFEMQYKQAQQQSGGGGQGQGEDQNALTRRQKELIAATHRLVREGARYSAQERADGYEAVAAGQEKLRKDTLEFIERAARRLGAQLQGQEDVARMAEHLREAAREMEGVPAPLRKQSGREALPPEQRALQQLLSADAIFREMQVAFGDQNSSSGGGGERESQELSNLFELELDKMKNQYETLQRERREQSQSAKTEAERRLEELARRQQQALEQQRRQQGQARNQSGGGASARQQQELIEETRRAARELERLSRERRDARLEELSRQLNQAANEMQQAQAASENNSNDSIAQGQRALERMEQARRRLQQSRGQNGAAGGRSQEIGELRQRAAEAAARQREIAKDVEALARRGGGQGQQDEASRSARQRLNERKDALADAVGNLEQDIEQARRSLGDGQGRAARELNEAAAALKRDRVAERIRGGKQSLENNQLEAARAGERAVERSLNQVSERLQSAEAAAGRAGGGSAEEALDRTRRLADDLESMRRGMDQNQARREGRAGQQQQQQQQQGASQSSGQQQQQGTTDSGEIGGTGGGDSRQLGAELRERLRDAEDLRRELGRTGGPVGELNQAIEQLRRLSDGGIKGDEQTGAALKAQVIEPLRQLELELSRRLREQLGRANLRLGDEGSAPQRYRKSVEEYYRRLSGGGKR